MRQIFLMLLTRTLLNLKYLFLILLFSLLCAHEAVDYEVNRAVENEEEVLDCSEGEHPAGVGGEHAQRPAQVCPLTYT